MAVTWLVGVQLISSHSVGCEEDQAIKNMKKRPFCKEREEPVGWCHLSMVSVGSAGLAFPPPC